MANHKPGSVPIAARSVGVYHLSSTALARSVYRPTLRDERAARSACADLGLFGLSARKVYPAKCITAPAVSSYLTFSPFPMTYVKGSFIFCGTICILKLRILPVRKYDALYCPDFPL